MLPKLEDFRTNFVVSENIRTLLKKVHFDVEL